jgi:uncharacterized protein (DUF2235 family)
MLCYCKFRKIAPEQIEFAFGRERAIGQSVNTSFQRHYPLASRMYRMSKNIVICCDGTGNEFGDANSNVVKLYSTLVIDKNQVGYYHPGVGTITEHGPIARHWSRIKGLAFGAGLLSNVGDAYRYLMATYNDGDKVFLFGFSRGAYTARVLGGMLHMFGLLSPGNEGLIPYILRIFAKKSRDAKGNSANLGLAAKFKEAFSRCCPLHFVGVWDTVDSVGWIWNPVVLPFAGQNPSIAIGRQALAIDERRSFYEPRLWGPPVPTIMNGKMQDIKQVWFSGAHSDVGGSYPEAESAPAEVSLDWMLGEAVNAGLAVRNEKVMRERRRLREGRFAKLHESLHAWWWLMEAVPRLDDREHKGIGGWRLPDFGRHRTIPENSVIHDSVFARMTWKSEYRPTNLPKNFVREISSGWIGSLRSRVAANQRTA